MEGKTSCPFLQVGGRGGCKSAKLRQELAGNLNAFEEREGEATALLWPGGFTWRMVLWPLAFPKGWYYF